MRLFNSNLTARLKKTIIVIGMTLVPSKRQVLIYGYPDHEENSLVLAAHLAMKSDRRVFLLCASKTDGERFLSVVGDALSLDVGSVQVRERRPLRDVWLFIRSRVVIYTHGLLDSPRAPRGRTHINLWHGTGAKRSRNQNRRQLVGASLIVACNETWGEQTAEDLGQRLTAPVLPGNPRQDLYFCTPRPGWRETLGLDSAAPYIVWMPTYRVTSKTNAGVLVDGQDVTGTPDGLATMQAMREQAEAAGLRLIVKPHPLDAASWRGLGISVITTEELYQAGITLHQFIGQAAGMISDYSSAWVDYLITSRPIGLFVPDLHEYASGRGLKTPTIMEVAPNLVLTTVDDFRVFFKAVSEGNWPGRHSTEVAAGIRYFDKTDSVTSRLVTVLDTHV